ncbi:MAG: SDR family NAD(P)-dependent oxidoreductase [Patescibacteria group bacterium]
MTTLTGKNVLVTGATGFIGSNLVDRLVAADIKVKALVRDANNIGKLNRKKVEIVEGDLTNYDSLDPVLDKVDVIFNLAAGLPHHHLSGEQYKKTNIIGLENLIKKAIEKKVGKVIHVSTVGVYGTNANNVDESFKPKPSDVYSRSKLAGERVVQKYKNKIAVVIVRPTIAYGPGDTRPGFLNLFKLIKKGMFVPVGRGSNYFHTIYIDNLIDGLLLVATNKQAIGQDFIIGDDPCPTMKEILSLMYILLGKKMPRVYIPKSLVVFGIPVVLNKRRVNFLTADKKYKIDKAKRILGYNPKVDLTAGLQATLKWYIKKGLI